jgi:hypothetical protein
LEPGPLREVDDWVGRYRRFWEESFDRLDAYLRELQQQMPEREPGEGEPDAE